MKRILLIFFMLAQLIFISPLFAELAEQKNDRAKTMANLFVNVGKKTLVKEYGDFPIQVDELTRIIGIYSDDSGIVYEYELAMNREDIDDSLMKEILIESLKEDQKVCGDKAFVNIMTKYQIGFIYKYHFKNESIMTIPIEITEACTK